MFEWLLRRLGRKRLRDIRTFDDLTAAMKAGEIKPHVYRDGDVQVVDFFAETGLSPLEREKVMLPDHSIGYPRAFKLAFTCG